MKKLILLVVIGVSLHCNAQISKESAYQILKTTILNNDWEDKEIFVSTAIVSENTNIPTKDTFVISPNYKSWFFFVDEDPEAEWWHSCKYVFINSNNNFVVIDMLSPPNLTGMTALNSILPNSISIDTSNWHISVSPKSTSISANEYAVIISGGYEPLVNWPRYWNHCSAIYSSLVNIYNYDKNKIFVIMSDGTNPAADYNMGNRNNPVYNSLPLDLDGDGTNDVQYAATKANIAMVFDTLSQRITSDDNVFVFVTDHGGEGSTIALWNKIEMTKNEFKQEVNKINHAKSVNLCMVQCYGGGYTTALAGDNRVITTACSANGSAYAMPPYYQYSEFCYHWLSAVSGYTPDTKVTVDADYNNDNFVSMEEAFQYAKNEDTRPEIPQYSSPTNPNVGAYLTLSGLLDVDLYTRDNSSDSGTEPLVNILDGFNDSPDIWLRREPDGGTTHQLGRQGEENYVYIRVHNRGENTSFGSDVVKLYIKRAGIGTNVWNEDWTMIGETFIPQIPSGESVVVRIDAEFPTYNNFEWSQNLPDVSYALLTRIESDFDDVTYTEFENTGMNVIQNNNISCKNVVMTNAVLLDDVITDVAIAGINNSTDEMLFTSLKFSSPINEYGNPLSSEAEIRIIFPIELVELWESFDKIGLEHINDTTFRVIEDNAMLGNICIPSKYEGLVKVQINFLTEEYSEKDKFEYVIEQYVPGSEEMQNRLTVLVDKNQRDNLFSAKCGEDLVVKENTIITLSAEDIGENAVYNWYNTSGDFVDRGRNISVTASSTEKYTLEVIAKADGYKDYDSMYVVTTLGKIESITPNPASGQTILTYDLSSNVSNARIIIVNSSGLQLYNSPIDVSTIDHTLNLQNLVAGQYNVRLVSGTGEVLDTKTLIVQ